MPDNQLGFDFDDDNVPNAGAGEGGEILAGAKPLADRLRGLAERGVFLGTSSWKYPGWLGRVYAASRYKTRNSFSQKKFNQTCLEEYARVFPAVGGDFSFYQFPSAAYWERLMGQVPAGFQFGLKVPEEITAERWPRLPRYGKQAGQDNESFLDAGLLIERFLRPLERHREKVGVIMFEFGTIRGGPLSEPKTFAAELDRLLSALPTADFRFAVEVRNANFLNGGGHYLGCLEAHGVAHVLNSWTRMPSLEAQLAVPGAITAQHVAARLLLRPGRTYAEAVSRFAPYETAQDVYDEGRAALAELIEQCLSEQRMLFGFVNNRFEGNAVDTIEGVVGG